MTISPLPVPPLREFRDRSEPELLALAKGEATRFQCQCDGYLAPLAKAGQALTAETVQQTAVRLTWAFFYSRKGADPAVHEQLLATYLHALERLHDVWLDVEKPKLIEERIVHVRPEPVAVPVADPVETKPRPRSVAEAMAAALADVL